jgi:hypothetical protein
VVARQKAKFVRLPSQRGLRNLRKVVMGASCCSPVPASKPFGCSWPALLELQLPHRTVNNASDPSTFRIKTVAPNFQPTCSANCHRMTFASRPNMLMGKNRFKNYFSESAINYND